MKKLKFINAMLKMTPQNVLKKMIKLNFMNFITAKMSFLNQLLDLNLMMIILTKRLKKENTVLS